MPVKVIKIPDEGLFRGPRTTCLYYLYNEYETPKEEKSAGFMMDTVLKRLTSMSSLYEILFGMNDTKNFHLANQSQFYHETAHPGDLTGFDIQDIISLCFDTFRVSNWSASFGKATLVVSNQFYSKLFPQVLGKLNITIVENDSTVNIGNLTIAMPSIIDAAHSITKGNPVKLLMQRTSSSAIYYFESDVDTYILSIDLETGKLQFVSDSITKVLVNFDVYKLRESAKAGLLEDLTDELVCQMVVKALENMQADPQLLKLYLESESQ